MSSNLDKDLLSGMLLYLTVGILFSIVFLIAGIYFNYQLNEEYGSILSLDKPHLIVGYSGSLNKTIDLKVLKGVSDLSNKYSRDKLEFYLKDGLIYGFRGVLDNEPIIVLVPSKPVLFSTFEFDLRPACSSTECLVKLESIATNESHNIKYTHGNLSLNDQTIPVTVVENYSNMYTDALYNAVRMLGGVGDSYLYIGTHIDEFLNSYTVNKGNSNNPAMTIIIYMFSKEPATFIPSNTHIIESFKNDLVRQLRTYNVNYVVVDLVTTSLKASLENIGSTIVYVEMILIAISLFVLVYAFTLFNKAYIRGKLEIYKSLASSGDDIAKLLKRVHIATVVSLIIVIIITFISYRITPVFEPSLKMLFRIQSILLGSIISIYIAGIDITLTRRLRGNYSKYKLKK